MVTSRRGQALTEFVIVMLALTAIGIFFVNNVWGPIPVAQTNVTTKIANDGVQ